MNNWQVTMYVHKLKFYYLCWLVHSPGMLTKVLCNFHISNSCFPIFKLWIGDFHSFHPICLSMLYIPLEIEVEMYCSQHMPVEIKMKKLKTLNLLVNSVFKSCKTPKNGPVIGSLDAYTQLWVHHILIYSLRMVTILLLNTKT